jgi:hypothetical protein
MLDLRNWIVAAAVLVGASGFPADAKGTEINACKVLTAADLEAALGKKVTLAGTDASSTFGGGPMKGETRYSCAWWLGGPPLSDQGTYVVVQVVSRPPQNPEETVALSQYRSSESEWKKKSIPIEVSPIPGGDCRVYQRPEGTITSCIGGAKGRGLVLDVAWPKGVSAPSLKPLVDKALSRF